MTVRDVDVVAHITNIKSQILDRHQNDEGNVVAWHESENNKIPDLVDKALPLFVGPT